MVRKVLTAAVASMIATAALAATGYHGPIIDTHAHIRLTDDDAVVAAAKADPDHFYPIASANTPYPQYGTNSYLLSQPLR